MTRDVKIPFGDGNVVTVRKNGNVDIRLVDDDAHITMHKVMHADEFAAIAKTMFSNIADNPNGIEQEVVDAENIVYHIKCIENTWRNYCTWHR